MDRIPVPCLLNVVISNNSEYSFYFLNVTFRDTYLLLNLEFTLILTRII